MEPREPVTIELTPSEVLFCACLAAERMASKQDKRPFTVGKLTRYGSHMVGTLCELAAQKHYGGRINQEISPYGDNHKPDLTTRSGQKLEIKGTAYNGPTPQLKLHPDELIDDRGYVLVVLQWPDTAHVYPIISAAEIARVHRIHDYGDGDKIVVDKDKILSQP